MSKFPNELSEYLYGTDADTTHGDSSEGIGWAGVYGLTDDEQTTYQEDASWIVLVERTDGFVDMFRADTLAQAETLASKYDV